MNNQRGITLISLVITIILIIILATVSIQAGIETYENTRVSAFVAKMIVIQEAVDKLCGEYTVLEINGKGVVYASAPADAQAVLNTTISQGSMGKLKYWYDIDKVADNYIYFDIEKISTVLGIKDFNTGIWLNPASRNVIAVNGVEFEDETFYRQYDLKGGQTLPEPNINIDFTLQCSVKTYDNKADIVLYKVKVADNPDTTDIDETELVETVFSQVKYWKQKSGTTEFGDVKILNNVSRIELTESGIYKVEATDFTKNTQTQESIEVAIVNKPLLVSGMTPIKYDSDGKVVENFNQEDWYNYGTNVKEWANVRLKDGSIYVWIPRFAYKINVADDENTAEIDETQTIDTIFLKEFSKIGTDGKIIPNTYKIAPAFQDGTKKGFANGEWDAEITGLWVAKYETIENEGKPQNRIPEGSDIQSWRTIAPNEAFNICRKMESEYLGMYFDDTKITASSGAYSYGIYATDNNNIDTHLMKNSEWGAAAYLSHSKYGAGVTNISKSKSYYINENSSKEYSCTNNYTGIYGLNGGTYEVVAAGSNIVNYFNLENKSTKYATVYSTENKIYGDAIKETSGWNGNDTNSITELIARGGNYKITGENNTGLFSYYNKNYEVDDSVTFRPVLIVEY